MSLTLWQPKSPDDKPLPPEWVRRLFDKFTARYGSLFTDRFGGLPMDVLEQEWGQELSGFTGEELSRGLEGCRTLKFPPTLPEFMALCRPPIDAYEAFVEAVRNSHAREQGENPRYTHPAIYWAAAQVSAFDMRTMTYAAIRPRWERALNEQMAKRSWPDIPVAYVPLPAPVRKPNPEVMAKLRELAESMRVQAASKERK